MTNETHSHPIKVSHPTAKCSIAAHLYFQWVAACRDGLIIGSNPPEMTEEGRKAAEAAKSAYEMHIAACRICRGAV